MNLRREKHNIEIGFYRLKNLTFNRDPIDFKAYLYRSLVSNQIKRLLGFTDMNLSPAEYIALRKRSPTSIIVVERSFSILGKFLAKDRNLKKKIFMDTFRFIIKKR